MAQGAGCVVESRAFAEISDAMGDAGQTRTQISCTRCVSSAIITVTDKRNKSGFKLCLRICVIVFFLSLPQAH